MNYVFKMMDYVSQMMDSVSLMMNSVSNMINCVFSGILGAAPSLTACSQAWWRTAHSVSPCLKRIRTTPLRWFPRGVSFKRATSRSGFRASSTLGQFLLEESWFPIETSWFSIENPDFIIGKRAGSTGPSPVCKHENYASNLHCSTTTWFPGMLLRDCLWW